MTSGVLWGFGTEERSELSWASLLLRNWQAARHRGSEELAHQAVLGWFSEPRKVLRQQPHKLTPRPRRLSSERRTAGWRGSHGLNLSCQGGEIWVNLCSLLSDWAFIHALGISGVAPWWGFCLFWVAGEVKDTTLESRYPRRDGVTSLCLPHLDDYTTSMSPASFFAALKIAKLSSLIAESPLPGGCPGQVSFIRDFILSTRCRMFSFSCQNHSYVDINISARDCCWDMHTSMCQIWISVWIHLTRSISLEPQNMFRTWTL